MKSGKILCHGAAASIPSWQIKEPREIDNPNASDGSTHIMKEKCMVLWPVSPFSSGEGLPYAPINWPLPGDNWSWSVGRGVHKAGYYQHRYMYPPISIQKPGCTNRVTGKKNLVQYIRTEFPDADLDAFFASFSWKVPARNEYSPTHSYPKKKKKKQSKVTTASHPSNIPQRMRGDNDEDEECEDEEETMKTYAKKGKQKLAPVPATFRGRTRQSFKLPFTTKREVINMNLTEETESSNSLTKNSSCASDFENDQVSSNPNCVSSIRSSIGTRHTHVAGKESVMDASQEPLGEEDHDYNYHLNFLSQDLSSDILENDMVVTQMKLSSLLALDFPLLINNDNLTELTNLLSKLQKDSSLTLDQRLKLQMIEEIPLNAKHFLETKKYMKDADDLFADVETNIEKVISLNKKCNQSKEKAAQCQAEIDSNLSVVQELDDQIVQLQSRRAGLADNVELKRVERKELVSAQGKVIESLSSIAQKVELGKSKKQEWELKKASAAKRLAEILARYESLKGFSL